MLDIAEYFWYVQDPRHVRARVGEASDPETDPVVCVADDASAAALIVNDHNGTLPAAAPDAGPEK